MEKSRSSKVRGLVRVGKNSVLPSPYEKHRERDSDPRMRAFVHDIPRKCRRLQRDRETSPSSSRIFRMYQRVDPNGPFLHVPL